MHEYAYDIKLAAVVRVKASSPEDAEAYLTKALDCAELDFKSTETSKCCRITEASLCVDDEDYPYLFEIDGISNEILGEGEG